METRARREPAGGVRFQGGAGGRPREPAEGSRGWWRGPGARLREPACGTRKLGGPDDRMPESAELSPEQDESGGDLREPIEGPPERRRPGGCL